jgi:hypothetical protein
MSEISAQARTTGTTRTIVFCLFACLLGPATGYKSKLFGHVCLTGDGYVHLVFRMQVRRAHVGGSRLGIKINRRFRGIAEAMQACDKL